MNTTDPKVYEQIAWYGEGTSVHALKTGDLLTVDGPRIGAVIATLLTSAVVVVETEEGDYETAIAHGDDEGTVFVHNEYVDDFETAKRTVVEKATWVANAETDRLTAEVVLANAVAELEATALARGLVGRLRTQALTQKEAYLGTAV